jgi:hypothetical protein
VGLGYKDGAIWASTDGYRFTLLSVNTPDLHAKLKKPSLVYTCETKSHRISIEETENDEFRYRSWNKPKSLSVTPDMVLSHGKQTFPGTGICSVPTYTFTSGEVTYEVNGGLGCTDGSEPVKATGRLSVTKDSKQVTDDWCF